MKLAYIDPGTGVVLLNSIGWLVAALIGFFGFITFYFKKLVNFVKNHKLFVVMALGILLLGGIIFFVFFFMKNNPSQSFHHKVIVLGIDGLSPKIMESMMQSGKLPHFSRLKSEGAYRELATTNPPQSPVAWAAFSTGKNPGKTGIFDFILRDPKDYSLELSLSNIKGDKVHPLIQDKRFWHYTSDRKIPTVIIGCPLTFPPDPVYGKMLSGMGVPDILGTQGTFTFYTSEPLPENKTTGGKVFHVYKSRMLKMDLIGPKISSLTGKIKHTVVPFKVVSKDERSAYFITQGRTFELKVGQWSDWQSVSFKTGVFKKMKGILKFYLVSLEPEFNLYISPINYDPKNSYFKISYPKNYAKELSTEIGPFYTQGMPVDTWALNEGRLSEDAFLEHAQMVFDERVRMLDYELERFKAGVFFFYFGVSDSIQHMFWRQFETPSSKYQKIIYDWYEKMDVVLGNVMRQVNKDDDTLIVLSDHGFGPFTRAQHINSWLRRNGFLELKDKEALRGQELLSDVDWSQTKAYAVGFGGIYINQKGREKEGIVPQEEGDSLKQTIAQKLEKWVDENNGMPVVSHVYFKENIFHGHQSFDAPDIYVGVKEGNRASWQTAMGAAPEGLIEDNLKKWSGDHLIDPELVPGIFFINKKLRKDKISIYDLAPTLLKEVGYSDAEIKSFNFDGTALF